MWYSSCGYSCNSWPLLVPYISYDSYIRSGWVLAPTLTVLALRRKSASLGKQMYLSYPSEVFYMIFIGGG